MDAIMQLIPHCFFARNWRVFEPFASAEDDNAVQIPDMAHCTSVVCPRTGDIYCVVVEQGPGRTSGRVDVFKR